MSKVKTKPIVFGIVVVIGLIIAGMYSGIIPTEFTFNDFRNTTPLAISDAVPIDCDVSNFMVVKYTDGTEAVVYTGRDGFIPNSFIQSNSLVDRTTGVNKGNEIELVKIQLALECSGSIMRQGSATVSGTNNASLCTYVATNTKECLSISPDGTIGGKLPLISPHPANDGSFCTDRSTIVNNVCILDYKDGLQRLTISPTTINNREIKVIQETILTTDDIFRLYGNPPPTRSIQSAMFPQINFVLANGQSLSVNQLAENDRTTTSWTGWTYVAPPVDTDGDGLPDDSDFCPTEASNEPDGCPIRDTDNDGVIDSQDTCPDTPSGQNPLTISPFIGCSNSQIDADADGIFNDIDVCPTMQENFNGFEDADGCPDTIPTPTDSDGDGIIDELDNCPNRFGLSINNGCPDIEPTDGCGMDPNGDCDGDGVVNSEDACPDTPSGATVNISGCEPNDAICTDHIDYVCGVDGNTYSNSCVAIFQNNVVIDHEGECSAECGDNPNDDCDGDGVIYGLDLCHDTHSGASVDSTGCVLPIINDLTSTPDDFDGDGVLDLVDDCPASGGNIDQFGCPIQSTQEANPVQDFFDEIFDTPTTTQPVVTPTLNQPQTSTSGSSVSSPEIIEGLPDSVTLMALALFIIIIVVVALIKSGKVKL